MKSTSPIDISKDSDYVLPKSIEKLENSDLQSYFQYYFARSDISPLSLDIENKLSDSEKDLLYDILIKRIGASSNDFIFGSPLRSRINDIRKLELSDSTLKIDKTKGFFHVYYNPQSRISESKIDSMLKHIRNSFAHGRIAFISDHLIIEDKKNEFSGRLVITIDDLEIWKNEIVSFMKARGANI